MCTTGDGSRALGREGEVVRGRAGWDVDGQRTREEREVRVFFRQFHRFDVSIIRGCEKDVPGWVGSAAGGVAVGVRGEVVPLQLQTRTLRAGWDMEGQRTREDGE